jgi:hypothetical protein
MSVVSGPLSVAKGMKQGAQSKALKQKTLCALCSAVRGESSEQALQLTTDHGQLTSNFANSMRTSNSF